MEITRNLAVGISLGQPADGSALALVEYFKPAQQFKFYVRDLCRVPPLSSYQAVIKAIDELLATKVLSQTKKIGEHGTVYDINYRILIVVDQTVVGGPIVDMILAGFNNRETCRVIISGNHTEKYSDGLYYVPKQTLISNMNALLETQTLGIKPGSECQALTKQLIEYRNQKTPAGSPTGNGWRERPSDDLVFAVGIACWKLENLGFFEYDGR